MSNILAEAEKSPLIKGCWMGRSDKVSFWYAALLINARFRFLILE